MTVIAVFSLTSVLLSAFFHAVPCDGLVCAHHGAQVLQLDDTYTDCVNGIWTWLQTSWCPGKYTASLLKNACGGADPLHLVATLLLALPHISGRHPLLNHPLDSDVFSILPTLYSTAQQSSSVEMFIDPQLSMRDLAQPIQIGLRASQRIKQGDVILYGGKPLDPTSVRNLKIAHPTSHACLIDQLRNVWVMDGRPFAMMIHRPVPGDLTGLDSIVSGGIDLLLPDAQRDGYSEDEIAAFQATPLGFLANCSPASEANLQLDWLPINKDLHRLPQLKAKVDIEPGSTLTWNYNNNERRDLVAQMNEPFCDVCCGIIASEHNPILLCDHSQGCLQGRHRNCFSGDELPSLQPDLLQQFKHRCVGHQSTQRALRIRAAAAAAAVSTRPQNNLPPATSVDSVEAPEQRFLAPEQWAQGLDWNCQQLGVQVHASSLPKAGNGLFATKDIAKGQLIGWFWGKFVTREESDAMQKNVDAGTSHECPDPDDFGVQARYSNMRCIDSGYVSDEHHEYLLLVSRQCPMSLINDPGCPTRCNVEWQVRTADIESVMTWQLLPVYATQPIQPDAEIFVNYAWSAKEWRNCARTSAS